jgi:NADH-quinone oxidoreductase subunit K
MFSVSIIYLITSVLLFFIGACGIFLSRKNLILMLMSLELMLLSTNMFLFFFSIYLDSMVSMVWIIYVLTLAAAETSIGLALIVLYYKTVKLL